MFDVVYYVKVCVVIYGMKGDYGILMNLILNFLVVLLFFEGKVKEILNVECDVNGVINVWKDIVEFLVVFWLV